MTPTSWRCPFQHGPVEVECADPHAPGKQLSSPLLRALVVSSIHRFPAHPIQSEAVCSTIIRKYLITTRIQIFALLSVVYHIQIFPIAPTKGQSRLRRDFRGEKKRLSTWTLICTAALWEKLTSTPLCSSVTTTCPRCSERLSRSTTDYLKARARSMPSHRGLLDFASPVLPFSNNIAYDATHIRNVWS